jgi:FkbM family methyltransferase
MYSTPAIKQDEWVVERLCGKYNGTYIDVGAHDGLHHSNTALLEKVYGWKGILVEPQRELFKKCIENRGPSNGFVRDAVGEDHDRSNYVFYAGGSYGGLEYYMPKDWVKEHKRRGTLTFSTKVTTLERLVQWWGSPDFMDYLSLDVEGAELPILERYFLREPHTHFRLMTVEFRFDYVLLRRLQSLLEPWYVLEEVRAFDAFFVHKDVPYTQSVRLAA